MRDRCYLAEVSVYLRPQQEWDIFMRELERLTENAEIVDNLAYQTEYSHHNGDPYRGDLLLARHDNPKRFAVIKAAIDLRRALLEAQR